MKASELRQESLEELKKEEEKIKEELFKLNLRKGLEQFDNPKRIKTLRKDLARVLTIMNEKVKSGEAV